MVNSMWSDDMSTYLWNVIRNGFLAGAGVILIEECYLLRSATW